MSYVVYFERSHTVFEKSVKILLKLSRYNVSSDVTACSEDMKVC